MRRLLAQTPDYVQHAMTPASAPQTIEPCFAAAHAFASCVSGTAGLLAKKDSMARELTAQLKRSEAGSPRPASAELGGMHMGG